MIVQFKWKDWIYKLFWNRRNVPRFGHVGKLQAETTLAELARRLNFICRNLQVWRSHSCTCRSSRMEREGNCCARARIVHRWYAPMETLQLCANFRTILNETVLYARHAASAIAIAIATTVQPRTFYVTGGPLQADLRNERMHAFVVHIIKSMPRSCGRRRHTVFHRQTPEKHRTRVPATSWEKMECSAVQ